MSLTRRTLIKLLGAGGAAAVLGSRERAAAKLPVATTGEIESISIDGETFVPRTIDELPKKKGPVVYVGLLTTVIKKTPRYAGGAYVGYSQDQHLEEVDYPGYKRAEVSAGPDAWAFDKDCARNIREIEWPECTGGSYVPITHLVVYGRQT